uniref:Methylmalonyl-CoA carboxyltransferase 12S subunit n=1 Tax=Candidatus Kentrum sp. LFY TaxID=2126342 RepID=A0A450UCM8_9GAMM|nr:MAG: methylmalonyl-CoA carboxyltransferase 12S subunit [Candidatus Kentron sp. LFY]VFJ99422.1 MAG: methylmalonyl-CoA carboxyltransferase 12S subunit [Candidatus Kentron sp. LFY]
MLTMRDRIKELREKHRALHEMGGANKVAKQHAAGKLTARERIADLVDPGSFHELMAYAEHRATLFGMDGRHFPAEAVITGSGTIDGRGVHIASHDFTVAGGSAGEVHCDKIVEMMKAAMKTGTPMIVINDSAGARVQEGIDALAAYGRIFYHNTLASGVIPQIALICGPCAGGAVYSPALTDFIIQTKAARMFITGPEVIKQVTGEDITQEALGGPDAHMRKSGVIHFVADDDHDALRICKRLLSFLPSNNIEAGHREPFDEVVELDEVLNTILPEDSKKPYDIRDVIKRVVDHADFMEVQERFAENIVIGFARIMGRTVGIIANQPKFMAGCVDINSSDKAARFIRFCNAFNIPVVTFVDVPGFLPGVHQEYGGIIRHGAKMLFAYSQCTVPKITVIIRKAYGGSYLAMCGKDLGADRVAAWPSAEVAVMGAEGAASIVFRKEIEEAEDSEGRRKELIEHYRAQFATPYVAAARRLVDDVIEPAETRLFLAQSLEALISKRETRPAKKHGNIPL